MPTLAAALAASLVFALAALLASLTRRPQAASPVATGLQLTAIAGGLALLGVSLGDGSSLRGWLPLLPAVIGIAAIALTRARARRPSLYQ